MMITRYSGALLGNNFLAVRICNLSDKFGDSLRLSRILLVHAGVVVNPSVQSGLDGCRLSADDLGSFGLLFPNGEVVSADARRIVTSCAVGIVALERVSDQLVSSDCEFISSVVIGDYFGSHIDPFSDGLHGLIVRHGQADAFKCSGMVLASFLLWVASVGSSSTLVDVDANSVVSLVTA